MSLPAIDFSQNPLKILRLDATHKLEWATKKLWMHIFSKYVFYEAEWVIGPEQPPADYGSLRRIDITIEVMDNNRNDLFLVCVCEKKKGRAEPADIKTVEDQASNRSSEHCEHTRRKRIWAMTMYGPMIRVWIYDHDKNRLIDIFPRGEGRQKQRYVDIKDQEYQAQLLRVFECMKAYPDPPDTNTARAAAQPSYSQEAADQSDHSRQVVGASENATQEGGQYTVAYSQVPNPWNQYSVEGQYGYTQGLQENVQYHQYDQFGAGAAEGSGAMEMEMEMDENDDDKGKEDKEVESSGKGKSPAKIEKSEHETGESSSGRLDSSAIQIKVSRTSGHRVYAYEKTDRKKKRELKFPLENWIEKKHPTKDKMCYAHQKDGKWYYTSKLELR